MGKAQSSLPILTVELNAALFGHSRHCTCHHLTLASLNRSTGSISWNDMLPERRWRLCSTLNEAALLCQYCSFLIFDFVYKISSRLTEATVGFPISDSFLYLQYCWSFLFSESLSDVPYLCDKQVEQVDSRQKERGKVANQTVIMQNHVTGQLMEADFAHKLSTAARDLHVLHDPGKQRRLEMGNWPQLLHRAVRWVQCVGHWAVFK